MTVPLITPLPPAPNRSLPPETFISRADAFVASLAQLQGEANTQAAFTNDRATDAQEALAEQQRLLAGAGFVTTSATSTAISLGVKDFAVAVNLSFVPGMTVSIAAVADPVGQRMLGVIVSYNRDTGALKVAINTLYGVGTVAGWVVSMSGPRGLDGPAVGWQYIQVNTTAAPGDCLMLDTGGMGLVVTLPAAPAEGDEVILQDYNGCFAEVGAIVAGEIRVSPTATNTEVLLDETGRYSFIMQDGVWNVVKLASGVI